MRKRSCIACGVVMLLLGGCGEDGDGALPELATPAAAGAGGEAAAPDAGELTFGRDFEERIYGVRIRDRKHTKPRVVFSVRVPDLSSEERVRVRGEVTLSRCNAKDIAGQSGDAANTPCDSSRMKSDPYSYAPRFSAAFVLSDSPNDAGGRRLSAWQDTVCNEGKHHCALALPEAVLDAPPPGTRWVNLVVTADANGNNAREWHVMEVEQHHGSLTVTRAGAGAGSIVADDRSEQLRSSGPMTVDRPKEDGDPTQVRRLLYQVKLDGLQRGDVVDADAKMRAVNGAYACDPLVTGELLLTANPDAREAKGPHDRALTSRNGANCSNHTSDGCRYVKSGAAAVPVGAPSTMYVSYVAQAVRSCAAADGSDKWHVAQNDGFIDAHARR